MNIQELSEATGVSVRSIQHYIARGLLARPEGRTRSAKYTYAHVQELRDVRGCLIADPSIERALETMTLRRTRAAEAAKNGGVASTAPIRALTVTDDVVLVIANRPGLLETEHDALVRDVRVALMRAMQRSRRSVRLGTMVQGAGHAVA